MINDSIQTLEPLLYQIKIKNGGYYGCLLVGVFLVTHSYSWFFQILFQR